MPSEPEFGSRKRDWTTLYRAIVILLSMFTAGGVGVYVYAADTFVAGKAVSAVRSEIRPLVDRIAPLEDLPPRVRRLEEVSSDRARYMDDITAWRRSKDEIDTRLMIILENQQRQLDRQQTIIDQLTAPVRR